VTAPYNVIVIIFSNSVTDNRRIMKIDMRLGHERLYIWNTVKVIGSKVNVTRSRKVVAQKIEYNFVNVTRLWKYICLIGNRGRLSE